MPSYLINAGLPSLPSGLTDKDAALVSPLYLAATRLAQELSAATGNVAYSNAELAGLDQALGLSSAKINIVHAIASVTIPYGAAVTLRNSAGKIGCDIADATLLTKPAHGICNSPSGIAAGEYGDIIVGYGLARGVAGTAIGQTYFLSTAGAVQATQPTADGVLNQVVGIGMGAYGLYLTIEPKAARVSNMYLTSATNLRFQFTDGSIKDITV